MLERPSNRPDVLYDARWDGPHGIARFSREVLKRLMGAMPLPPGPGLFNPLSWIWLARTISRLNPRVYFTPGFNVPLTSSRPFVFVIHDLNYILCAENADPIRRSYFELFVRPASRRALRVLTVSEFSRLQILDWTSLPSEQVVNVGNGVSNMFSPTGSVHAPGYPYILYVGNRLPHKNLPRLFSAFASARLDCNLVLTGAPDNATRALTKQWKVDHAVRYAGAVADAELASLYRGSLAVVLPSLFEGFGLPVAEAMACGIPVIASNTTSLPEIVGDAGLLIDPRSVDELATALYRVVFDTALRANLKSHGLRRAVKFTWEGTAAAVTRVLQLAY